MHHLKRAFIPHPGNDFRPHALRPRALSAYAVAVIVAKVAVTALLFLVYPNAGFYSTATSERFFELTNAARQDAGVKPLVVNAKLARAAARKADDILTQGYFAHTSPAGKKFWQWIKDENYRYTAAGENLALDFADADIAQQALMDSSGHRANILNVKYTQVGFAVKSGEFKNRKTTVLVELFGNPVPVVSRPTVAAAEVPQPAPKPQPTPPVYAAAPASPEALDLPVDPGHSQAVTVAFVNRGTATWTREGADALTLEAVAPIGRRSALAASAWESPSRAARMAPDSVAPGETGRWVFTISGPQQTGAYVERFGLVRADGTPVPRAEVTLTVTVVAPEAKDPAPLPATAAPEQPQPPTPEPEVTTETIAPSGEVVPAATPQPASTQLFRPGLAALARAAVASTNGAFLAFIVFLTVALFVNVVVRYEIQHRHVIAGTLLIILLTAGMLVLGIHFLQLKPIVTPLLA